MTNRQFSRHMGEIDPRLVEQAENVPNYARQARQRLARRAAAAAAARPPLGAAPPPSKSYRSHVVL